MSSFIPWAEAPLSYFTGAIATVTLVWKTVGLHFLPGWEEMFGGPGSQYPRQVQSLETDAPGWRLYYLGMYGILGTTACLSGVMFAMGAREKRKLSQMRGGDSPSVDDVTTTGKKLARLVRLVGLFHTILGIHHTLWAISGGTWWGNLRLEQFNFPGLYLIGGIGGFWTGLHGLRLLLAKSNDPLGKMVRHKIVVDGVSVLTFISVLLMLPMNALGMERNLVLERWSWVAVFVCPAVLLVADFFLSKS